MPEQDEFTDSTDWLPTPLAALAPLESSLRCQVCKDFFTTPMMTSCSHTFCSRCIRRYLSQEGRCPACREPDQEIKLRQNWVVQDLVAHFTASRKSLLIFATNAVEGPNEEDLDSGRPKKRRKVAEHVTNGIGKRSTRSQSKRMAGDGDRQSAPSSQVVIDDSEEGSVYADSEPKSPPNGERNDGLVGCPCCHRRMKETLINAHLDKCIAGESGTPIDDTLPPGSMKPQTLVPPGTIAYTQRNPSKEQSRLPFINYSLLNDNSLRKKLRDLGISSHGSKELMRRRHTEWVNLWNANCDSISPVSKRQLLQDLKVWEDTLGRQVDRVSSSGFMAKDFDRELHVKSQKSNFDGLIQQARERVVAAKQASTAAKDGTSVTLQSESTSESQHVSEAGSFYTTAALLPEQQQFSMRTIPTDPIPSPLPPQIPSFSATPPGPIEDVKTQDHYMLPAQSANEMYANVAVPATLAENPSEYLAAQSAAPNDPANHFHHYEF